VLTSSSGLKQERPALHAGSELGGSFGTMEAIASMLLTLLHLLTSHTQSHQLTWWAGGGVVAVLSGLPCAVHSAVVVYCSSWLLTVCSKAVQEYLS
jgi:hypothetical protein